MGLHSEEENVYVHMVGRRRGPELEEDDYPPYWPPGTPPVVPSWRPTPPASQSHRVQYKLRGIVLEKATGPFCKREIQVAVCRDEAGNLGFNLRYGHKMSEAPESRTLVITRIKPGGPAFRSGCIRVGDRLLAVNGVSLLGVSLQRALETLRGTAGAPLTRLTLQVDVLNPARPLGQMLVELYKFGGDPSLGISMVLDKGNICVTGIQPGSVAYRNSILRVGDQLLGVNGATVGNPTEAVQSFGAAGEVVLLKVAPPPKKGSAKKCPGSPGLASLSGRGSSASLATTSATSTLKSSLRSRSTLQTGGNSGCSRSGSGASLLRSNSVSHSETISLTLQAVGGEYGLALEGMWPPVISEIAPGSPADVCGCLQPGDRVLMINQTCCECLSASEAAHLIANSLPILKLHVQFDVADAVVPSSGVFMVKLARRGSADLGIYVAPSKIAASVPSITKIRRGSVAHRSGALQCGDKLLEICGVRPGAEDNVIRVLQMATQKEIVSLKVLKANFMDRNVHTVEMVRLGGPLGLTISGTEQRDMPITVSAIKPGGLAESTGALFVGDRLLSINGHDLKGYKLSEAIDLLQQSRDVVTLQIVRPELTLSAKQPVNWDSGSRMRNVSSTESDLSMVWMDQPDEWESTECSTIVEDCLTEEKSKTLDSSPSTFTVTLFKDRIYEDFGFSLSDGLYERGVFINRIRSNGPADNCGLQPFDRILQVNGTRTQEFDCCLTVPLIADAGDKIELQVSRNPFAPPPDFDQQELEEKDDWVAEDIETLRSFSDSNKM